MVDYIPKSKNNRDADRLITLTGSDGATGRTFTLESNSIIDGMVLRINGAELHYGASADFTFSSGVVTLNNAVFNSDFIDITYFLLVTSSSSSSTGYCTVEDVLDYIQLSIEVPDYENQVTTKETVGTADGTTSTTYYLDHSKVIDGTQVIYYGSGETTTSYLTETTDYTINNERGSFVMNSTTAGTATLYATYKYAQQWKSSVVQDMINSKTKLIDDLIDKDFSGDYVVVREEQLGKGAYDRHYKALHAPVKVFKGQLNGAVGSTATSFTLDDTTGLTIGDYCSIESEVILVVTIPSTTTLTVSRAQLGTTGATHADDTFITNTVIEITNTPIGSTPNWYMLQYKKQYDIDSDTGAVQLLHVNAGDRSYVTTDAYPSHRIFDRFRRTYSYGSSTVPTDIKNLCILMVAQEMFGAQVLNALSRGTNGFNTEGLGYVKQQIEKLILKNKRIIIDGN